MNLTAIAAISGFLAVAFGAFGAHGLEGRLTEEGTNWWQTATFYLLTHAVLAAALGLYRGGMLAGWLAIAGAWIFAGTLYAMALGAPRFLGAVTPIGGLLMLAGWALLVWASLTRLQA
jgi:uncharacterized membrane protein YgdD (TMEM256/DUF423 family)